MTRRNQLCIVVTLVGLLLVVAWSYQRYSSSRRQASDAATDLADCRQLVEGILHVQAAPVRASMQSQSTDQLASRIEDAAAEASMTSARLPSACRSSARRVCCS